MQLTREKIKKKILNKELFLTTEEALELLELFPWIGEYPCEYDWENNKVLLKPVNLVFEIKENQEE